MTFQKYNNVGYLTEIKDVSGNTNTIVYDNEYNTLYRYDMSKIPLDLPWGYYLEIYWDGQLVETFTIPTPQ